MANITVTDTVQNGDNLYYIQSSLGEMLKRVDCKLKKEDLDGRSKLTIEHPEYYSDIFKTEIHDKVAEIIAIKYKYDYFKRNLKLSGLSIKEKEILLVSMIAADLEEDKRYAYERIKKQNEICIDGIFNFRLQQLKGKWQEVVSYMPDCFFPEQLKEFVTYLKEHRKKRVYVDNGRVYDNYYRRMKRCSLIEYDQVNVVRELILTNCGEVEISGKLPQDDEKYVKEYYSNKIIFSTGYFS